MRLVDRFALHMPPASIAQPIFQPVTLNVLPRLLIVRVRSAMPGKRRHTDVGWHRRKRICS